ncbi:MAG: lasso peptide biosynthesis B2 protein [Caulobacteraceae bacterium]|nr:lasso peptide biosynthesis B2 protein [Caulobacteraceae bacterium]
MSLSGPPPKRLGREVHAISIDDDIVILDLERDAYLCLPDTYAPAEGVSLAAALSAAGFPVIDDPDGPSPYALPALPRADLGNPISYGFTPTDIARAAQATLDILICYRGRTISQLIKIVESARTPGSAHGPDARSLARQFQRWVVLPPVPAKCLVRSFMLLRHLQRHGASAQWIFGVRTWPFRAHCWVQSGDVVLDDYWERLIPYRPLLAVRA